MKHLQNAPSVLLLLVLTSGAAAAEATNVIWRFDGKQVWNWECSGPQEAPAWANGGLRPVGNNCYLDALNGWQLALVECDFSFATTTRAVEYCDKATH